jgi:acetyltransferase
VEGVELNIQDGYAASKAYNRLVERVKKKNPEARIKGITVEKMVTMPSGREINIGVAHDPIFGPIITFGLGGTMVEILKDQAVTLPPLNEILIHHLMKKTRAWDYLQNFRNLPPANLKRIVDIFLRVSELVCEIPWVQEMDLNPILVDENQAVVLDARIILDPTQNPIYPYSHMAIHPYPYQLVRKWQLPDGTEITIRPIRPEDAKIEKSFVEHLSPQTKYFRFLGAVQELTQAMLVRFTQIDYDREMAFIAALKNGLEEKEIAVGRYVTYPDGEACEFAIVVADEWQGKGIGHQIMLDLIRVAASKGLKKMVGDIFSENKGMIAMAQSLGFETKIDSEEPEITGAVKILNT